MVIPFPQLYVLLAWALTERYINTKPFLHTKPSKLQFSNIQSCQNRTKGTILKCLQSVIDMYERRGYSDNKFNVESLIQFFDPINFHIYAPEEHVHKIERGNRTFKEKRRTICHTLPYRKYPKVMLISLVPRRGRTSNPFLHRKKHRIRTQHILQLHN